MDEYTNEPRSLSERVTDSGITRRDLVKLAAGATAGAVLSGCASGAEAGSAAASELTDPIYYSSAKAIAASLPGCCLSRS